MASVLELLLKETVSPGEVVNWLKCKPDDDSPACLTELNSLKIEFIPFLLNYLRDHTIHLIQTSKSATPSPAKTPSLKKLKKSVKSRESGGKRQQLFGANPCNDEDYRNLPASVFSPNTSTDSPGCNYHNSKPDRHGGRGNHRQNYSGQKNSPQCGSQRSSPHLQQTPEQRSKQKLSLGEFMHTPNQNNSAEWKRKSPHSGSRKEFSIDCSPSPVSNQGRKSSGKKRQSYSPLVQNITPNQSYERKEPPVFSLTSTSDFPPMNEKIGPKRNNNRRSLDSIIPSSKSDDGKISRVINFSNNESHKVAKSQKDRLQEVRRISPVTVQYSNNPGPRRITPTVVRTDNSVSQNSAFLVPIEESDNDTKSKSKYGQEKTASSHGDSLKEERERLKEERAKSHSSEPGTINSLTTPTKKAIERGTSVSEITEAHLSDVTCQDKLDILVVLYSKCLDCNLLPNVIVELYFLIQLLTAHGGNVEDTFMYGEDVIEENYLSTVHNTVYFAISVLEQQKRLLRMLDKSTLYLMYENQRVTAFSSDLQKYLEDCYERAESMKGPAFPRSPIGSVSFQADTDNRKNFPNDRSFHLFKRQRDGFYELIREWEASRMNSNYNMAEMFGERVRALVNIKTELANLIHFSRLFQSQLIAMCKGDGSICTNNDDENIALLSELKQTNPEKFKRLQERFIKPQSYGGPCPNPTFPGIQEFFRDFIVIACNPLLNQHLCDTFSAKVLELNDTTFSSSDDDDVTVANGDNEEKDMFGTVLLSVRLVGKFLGFVTFLPYQSPDRIPDSMESTYINIRNQHQPSLDMLECLQNAVTQGCLTLTVPWVVEYLSMMDSLAPRLEHYQTVLYLILYIHRYIWCQLEDEMNYGNLLVIVVISWLFENPVIPDGVFFMEIPDEVIEKIQDKFPTLGALDNRSFVDQSLFYKCCPYIGELRTLLVDFAVGSSSKVTNVRKITPVSADIPVQKSLTERQLQLQMEENFFHNHPASMKRVVDFVADRTASNFIKKFRSSLLHDSIVEGKDKVLKQLSMMTDGSPTNKLKDRVIQVTNKVSQELYVRVKSSVMVEVPQYCGKKILDLVTLMLPDDQSMTVVKMASKISERIAEEKIINWLNKHVTAAMYHTEIIPDLEKVSKTINATSQDVASPSDKTRGAAVSGSKCNIITPPTHDDTSRHPSEVLIDFKDCIKNITLRGWKIPDNKLMETLEEIKVLVENRQDILPSVHKSLTQLTMELVIALLVYQPESYTDTVITFCINLWNTSLNDIITLSYIFSGRIIMILRLNENQDETWKSYTELLIKMYKDDLLQPKQIQDNGLAFIPNIQDEEMISKICDCLCTLTEAVPVPERAENLGSCLELVFNMLPEGSKRAIKILHLLGLNDVTDLENDMNQLNVA
ncbi:Codanin-1 C-terminus [Mactra antiquata]